MSNFTCSVFFHNYYGGHENWVRAFCEKIRVPFTLYYNIVGGSVYAGAGAPGLAGRMQDAGSGSFLKKIVLRQSPNQGKDIGGKLVLLDAYMRDAQNNDHIIFLHDKKSPYKVHSREWANKLFQVIEPAFVEKALNIFSKHEDIGIIAPANTILNEYDIRSGAFISNNRAQLTALCASMQLTNTDYRYVAGTMFWVREAPLLSFFSAHPPLDIRRTLEKGNVMDDFDGTQTHSWERLLSWLIFAQGYTIKGL